jgi:delta24-sterol reductase
VKYLTVLYKVVIHFVLQVYPVWLCPFKLPEEPGMLSGKVQGGEELYVDIGVYGVPKVSGFKPRETTRRIEEFVRKNRG